MTPEVTSTLTNPGGGTTQSGAAARTFHLSLDVPDLEMAVAFYEELFGVAPVKREDGYAKFELADPPVALALQEGGAGLSHLGIKVRSTEEVTATSARLKERGLATFDERDTTCCYARQDKVWVMDPAGHRWEVYTVLEDTQVAGSAPAFSSDPSLEEVCCEGGGTGCC